jgi:hypothetical protein
MVFLMGMNYLLPSADIDDCSVCTPGVVIKNNVWLRSGSSQRSQHARREGLNRRHPPANCAPSVVRETRAVLRTAIAACTAHTRRHAARTHTRARTHTHAHANKSTRACQLHLCIHHRHWRRPITSSKSSISSYAEKQHKQHKQHKHHKQHKRPPSELVLTYRHRHDHRHRPQTPRRYQTAHPQHTGPSRREGTRNTSTRAYASSSPICFVSSFLALGETSCTRAHQCSHIR